MIPINTVDEREQTAEGNASLGAAPTCQSCNVPMKSSQFRTGSVNHSPQKVFVCPKCSHRTVQKPSST